jgi:uncharacterized protein YegJ (DUF2314 family)
MEFFVVDAFERNREYPDSFQIPSSAEVKKLDEGSFAKLVFQTNEKTPQSEKMWVRIIECQGDNFVGELDTDSTIIPNLSVGQRVIFERRHIVAVDI